VKRNREAPDNDKADVSSESPAGDSGAQRAVESVSRIVNVRDILKAVSNLTGMRYVVVARVTDDRWIACAVLDEMEFGLGPGGELEVATTLCSEVRDHRNPIVIEHASEDTVYCDHPTPKKYGIESYIAVPIILKNGEFFGTLCAVDSKPADLSSPMILESLDLFAQLIATELGNEDSYVALVESEDRRRESEDRIRAVTDAMPGLISYIDREYRYQFVNRAYTDWYGLEAEDLVGKPVVEVAGKVRFENVQSHFDAAFKGETETFETEVEHPRGGKRFVRTTFTPDVLNGKVRGIFVLAIDITEEKLAQDAVKRSDERYKAFIQQSTEGIWRFELEKPIPTDLSTEEQLLLAYTYGYLAECNDAMARQYGFSSASEIVGSRLADLLVQDDPKNVEFLRAFIESDYHLSEAESHEKDAGGNDRYFLNNFVGIVEQGFLLRAWGTQRDITGTREALDATARLAAIVVSSEDAIISKDLMGIVTSWNTGATKMFGYRADEVIGKSITMLMPEERINESAEILRRIRREENVEHFETVRRRKDGTDIIVSLTVSPIRSPDGNVIGASKIVRDITDRKRIEETIHHNQAMLSLAMQSSRMGVWELDLATNTVTWSPELEEIFGLEQGSFGGTQEHFFELVHEDDRDAAWNEVRAAIADHREYTVEFRFLHADGSTRWMEGRGEAVYSQKGEAVRLYGVGIDITERKEAENALHESERRFSRFMQHLPGLAWIKDLEGKYVYANESAEKAFGVSGPNLYGRKDDEIFPAETAAQFREHDKRALESGSGIQIAEAMIESDGVLHHSIVSKFPIIAADGKPALIGGMAIDVTDQKQAEEALRQRMDFDEAVMRNMAEGLYTVDAQGLVTSMNPAAEKLFGWTFEELRGRKMHDVTHYKRPDGTPFPADDCAGLQVMLGEKTLVDHEDVFIRRDGTFFDVLYSSSALRENDQNVGLVVVFTDITERKLAEQRLALQEEISELIRTIDTPNELLYRVAASVGPCLRVKRALFNEIDLANDVETVHRDYVAEGVKSVAGVHAISDYSPVTSAEMISGKTVVNHDSKKDKRTAEHYERSYEPNGERAYVAIPLLRNGAWVASLWLSDDEPRQWSKEDVALLETIAERTWAAVEKMRIDKALRESQERFSKAFNSGPLVFTLSSLKDGRLVEVNDTFVEVTGYSREEAIGKTSIELGLWTSDKDRDEEMDKVRNAGQVRNLEYSFRTRNGEEIIGILSAEKIEIGGEPFALTVIQDITDRKRSNEALRQSEVKYRTLFDSMDEGYCIIEVIFNDEGRPVDYLFIEVNSAFERQAGMRNVTGKRMLEFVSEIEPHWLETYGRVARTGEPIRFANEYKSLHRWFDVYAFRTDDLVENRVAVLFNDITNRVRSEEKIRESEARFRTMADNAPVMIWVTDPTGHCTFLSQSWYEYTGQNPETGLGFGWLKAIHPDDREKAERELRAANERCERFTTEYRFANEVGEYHWAIDSAQPRFDALGNYLGFIGSVVDIHERKLAQEAVVRAERHAAEQYQALLGRIVPLAATLGRARELTTIYRAVRDFIQASMPCSGFFVSFFEAEKSLRHAAYVWGEGSEIDISLLPPMPLIPKGGGANSRAVFEKRTLITNNYWDDMKNRPHVVLEPNGIDPMSSLIVPMMIKDTVLGTLEVQAHENDAFNEEHAVALEMAANLAAVAIENVRLIDTEAAAREAAESANRAKDEFLSVLSHELRTPLNAMLGWVRMLKAGVLDEENSERALEVIERNTRLQSSLIEDLLDVSRIISGKMRIETELVDLVSVVTTVSETIQPLAHAKDVTYRFVHDDDAVFLNADAIRLQQVVSNLLQNSIKFTPAGGSVELRLERTANEARLSVKDTGVGIEPDLLPHIFDRFRQADASARRNFTGLGLGLTIVRNIVELHGGAIDVYSAGKDRGATFTLSLPLAADFYNAIELQKRSAPEFGGTLEGKTILLVDDDVENLMPLKIFLENERAAVPPAANAREALEHLAEQDFNLMITDIGMPEIDGYELVSRLRADAGARNAALNAIALTAYASVDDRERALQAGFQAHLAKPVNYDELLAAIERLSKKAAG